MNNFITKEELKSLLGSNASDYFVKKTFTKIRELAIQDLTKKGLIIPNKKLIPTIYAQTYLKGYGINVEIQKQ